MSTGARTWWALALPPSAWFVFEQGLSALLHADCAMWQAGLAWGIASLLACAAAARMAWPLRGHSEDPSRPWLARLVLALAGIFGLAVSFQMLAVVLVPTCVG